MAARVIFVFLYGSFIEGQGRFLRPSHVYRFSSKQAKKTSDSHRLEWIEESHKPNFRTQGAQWYADTTREPIRDNLLRNGFEPISVIGKDVGPGHETTSSRPIHFLSNDFARLMEPTLLGRKLDEEITKWRDAHISKHSRQRMALRASTPSGAVGKLSVKLPNGTVIQITDGQSNAVVKALIEEFSKEHLKAPAVLWVSASDEKSRTDFVELSEKFDLKFNLSSVLPDLILAETDPSVSFLFCEVVMTDGAVTEARKNELSKIIANSSIDADQAMFLSAFWDRESPVFKKLVSSLARDSLVWFRCEPETLVIISTEQKWLPRQ
jgi:hypothetical protein